MITDEGLIEFQFRGETVRVNTALILRIEMGLGERMSPGCAKNRRLYNMWQRDNEFLSLFWTPCNLHTPDYEWDYWRRPHVSIVSIDGKRFKTFIYKNNDEARAADKELKEMLYKVVRNKL